MLFGWSYSYKEHALGETHILRVRKMMHALKSWSQNLSGEYYFEDLSMDGMIIVRWMLGTQRGPDSCGFKVYWRTLPNTIMNLRFAQMASDILTSYTNISIWGRPLWSMELVKTKTGLTHNREINRMPALVCVVSYEASVISGIGLHNWFGVDSLVRRLRIQDEARHFSGPWVRPSVLVPVRQKYCSIKKLVFYLAK